MKMRISAIALVLTACGNQSADNAGNLDQSSQQPVAQKSAARPIPPAKPFSVEEDKDLYSFGYSWPAEAAAVPQLTERFTKDMEAAKAELIKDATEDHDERAKQGYDFHAHEAQRSYETAGKTDRLLSLEGSAYGFTGGAHGSTGSSALLWDYSLAREVSLADLLQAGASWTGAIRQPFCVLLDREREERRGEPVVRDDMFGNCPEYKEITVVLQDSDKNGSFDHIKVIADQYVAGPYAEGPYEIELPITATMIERLKPEYRASFEPRPPVN